MSAHLYLMEINDDNCVDVEEKQTKLDPRENWVRELCRKDRSRNVPKTEIRNPNLNLARCAPSYGQKQHCDFYHCLRALVSSSNSCANDGELQVWYNDA